MVTDELRAIADELDEWDEAGAARVRAVATAIETPDKSDGWAGVDAREAVGLESIVDRLHERHARPRLVSQLERVRNLLVLFPILLTWFSLVYAANGYSAAVAADAALIQRPFLLLWEEGFQGHLGPWEPLRFLTLSFVALVDVIVIVAILGLTWVVHGQTSVALAAATEETQELEGRLQEALWQATLEFRSRGSMSAAADRFGRTAKRLLDELKAERTHLEELVNGRERRMGEMRSFTEDFRTSASDMSDVSHKLAVAVATSVDASVAMAATVQALARQQAGLQSKLDGLTQQTAQVAGSIQQIAVALEAANGSVADSAEAIGPGAIRISDSAEVLRREVAELRKDLETDRQTHLAIADRSTAAMTALTSQIEELGREIRTMRLSG